MQNTPSSDYSETLERLPENFQADWESLIRASEQARERKVKQLPSIQTGSGEVFEQSLFAEATPEFRTIRVGAILEAPDYTVAYYCRCFSGYPAAYGDIIVAEPHVDIKGKGRNISLPADKSGPLAMELSSKYDTYIVQAVANVLGQKVLHTIEVGYEDSPRKKSYLEHGYAVRSGYPQVVDRIFEPVNKNGTQV